MDRTGFRHSPARIVTYSKAAERAEAHLAQNIQTKEGDSQHCQREGWTPGERNAKKIMVAKIQVIAISPAL